MHLLTCPTGASRTKSSASRGSSSLKKNPVQARAASNESICHCSASAPRKFGSVSARAGRSATSCRRPSSGLLRSGGFIAWADLSPHPRPLSDSCLELIGGSAAADVLQAEVMRSLFGVEVLDGVAQHRPGHGCGVGIE